MIPCPDCEALSTRVVCTPANSAWLAAGIVLVPILFLGCQGGDERRQLLPLARRCSACGLLFTRRSAIDDILGRPSLPSR